MQKNTPFGGLNVTQQNKAVNETLEDYTLRYAPHSFRVWSPRVIAVTALGGIAYLADFSIGASIGMAYGTINAITAIIFAAILIFITGLPLSYYAARYNIDLDLITRSSGFGYFGSIITSIIFATFTFIFFALEGAIMAQGLLVGLNIPLWLGYLISTFMVIPLVIYGMKALTKMQVWTTPIWLILMVGPVSYLMIKQPELVQKWVQYQGNSGYGEFNIAAVMLGAGVVLALIAQIGEQIDYLRFMPAKIKKNKKEWWISVVFAGPGWVILGAIKQIIGAFLGFYLLTNVPGVNSTEPVQQFISTFEFMMNPWLAMFLAVVLVVISQIKINVSNAYSGSLAWTSAYTRITKKYPGRIFFVIVNLAFALTLMEMDMFSFLHKILSFYSNCAISWITVVASDIVINKYILKLSPKKPEFRKDMIYNYNPVGLVSFGLSAGLSIGAYFSLFGDFLSSYSPLIAFVIALVTTPIMCVLTKGKYYIKNNDDGIQEPRFTEDGTPSHSIYHCTVCNQDYERPDVMFSHKHKNIICSLCKTMEK